MRGVSRKSRTIWLICQYITPQMRKKGKDKQDLSALYRHLSAASNSDLMSPIRLLVFAELACALNHVR